MTTSIRHKWAPCQISRRKAVVAGIRVDSFKLKFAHSSRIGLRKKPSNGFRPDKRTRSPSLRPWLLTGRSRCHNGNFRTGKEDTVPVKGDLCAHLRPCLRGGLGGARSSAVPQAYRGGTIVVSLEFVVSRVWRVAWPTLVCYFSSRRTAVEMRTPQPCSCTTIPFVFLSKPLAGPLAFAVGATFPQSCGLGLQLATGRLHHI